MSDDIQFLVDDLEVQNKKELDRLLKILEHPLMESDTYILWKFTRALMKAAKEKKWLEENHVVEKHNDEIKIKENTEDLTVEEHEIYSVDDEGKKDVSLKFSQDTGSGLFIPEMPDAPKPGVFVKQEDLKIANKKRYAIVFDKETNKGLVYAEINGDKYGLIEPALTPRDEEIIKSAGKKFGEKIVNVDRKKLSEFIEKLAKKQGIEFNDVYFVNTRYYLMRDYAFSGKIEALLHDDKISKITCDGANSMMKVEYNGIPLNTEMKYDTAEEINSIIEKLAKNSKMKIKKNEAFNFNFNGFKVEGISGDQARFTFTRL